MVRRSLENNKLIAEFMGYTIEGEYLTKPDMLEALSPEEVHYDSWSWLMPVVEKIESLGYTTSFKTNYLRINPKEGNYDEYVVWLTFNKRSWFMLRHIEGERSVGMPPLYIGTETLTKIEAIYKCVTEFIIWYNLKLT